MPSDHARNLPSCKAGQLSGPAPVRHSDTCPARSRSGRAVLSGPATVRHSDTCPARSRSGRAVLSSPATVRQSDTCRARPRPGTAALSGPARDMHSDTYTALPQRGRAALPGPATTRHSGTYPTRPDTPRYLPRIGQAPAAAPDASSNSRADIAALHCVARQPIHRVSGRVHHVKHRPVPTHEEDLT